MNNIMQKIIEILKKIFQSSEKSQNNTSLIKMQQNKNNGAIINNIGVKPSIEDELLDFDTPQINCEQEKDKKFTIEEMTKMLYAIEEYLKSLGLNEEKISNVINIVEIDAIIKGTNKIKNSEAVY